MRERIWNQTLNATAWDQFWQALKPYTPMGEEAKLRWRLFRPGEEEDWRRWIARQQKALTYLQQSPASSAEIVAHLKRLLPLQSQLQMWMRGQAGRLTDWFQLQEWLTDVIGWLQHRQHWAEEAAEGLHFTQSVQNCLSIFQDEGGGFTLSAESFPQLATKRAQRNQLVQEQNQRLHALAQELAAQYQVVWNRDGECWVPLTRLQELKQIHSLQLVRTTPFEAIFTLAPQRIADLTEALSRIEEEIAQEEERILLSLVQRLQEIWPPLWNLHQKLGEWELEWLAIEWAMQPGQVAPELQLQGELILVEGRHPILARSFPFTPLSLRMREGVTLLTGANMGGKSVALQTLLFLQLLVQYGFFVPAQYFSTRLFQQLYLLTGDGQDATAGLSSFGFELVAIQTILQQEGESTLLCLDEFARGTNPLEGSHFASALVRYLHHGVRGWFTLFVTHFQEALTVEGIRLYRTGGLVKEKLKEQGERKASQRSHWESWIAQLQGWMDYRLYPCRKSEIPAEAKRIAQLLHLHPPLLQLLEEAYQRKEGESKEV